MIFLRCYRLFAVFSYYEGYLKEQKRMLMNEADNMMEQRATMIDDGRITITSREGEAPAYLPSSDQVSENADAFFDGAFRTANDSYNNGNNDHNTSVGDDDTNRERSTHARTQRYRMKLPDLQESTLLLKAYKWFLGPSLLIGILAIFFPLFYSIVPAHESGVCICNIL